MVYYSISEFEENKMCYKFVAYVAEKISLCVFSECAQELKNLHLSQAILAFEFLSKHPIQDGMDEKNLMLLSL